MNTSLCNNTIFVPKFSFIRSSLLLSHRTQIQNSIICARKAQQPVICARKSKRRNGSQRLTRFALELISIMASKTNILPQPLDLVIGEIGCGDGNGGGGVWFWKVFGGRGFGGWRRKRKRNMLLLGFLLIFGLGLLFVKEVERNALCGCLGIVLLDVVLIQWWGKRSKDLVLGICIGGVLMGFGLRREQVQKWVERVRVCPPMMDIGRRRRGKGGRAL